MSVDIVDRLRAAHQTAPIPSIASLYSNAADEIVRLGGRLAEADTYADLAYADATRAEDEVTYWKARARRAEADADRLAAEVMRLMCACTWRASGVIGYRCTKCVVLDLHDREVEAR